MSNSPLKVSIVCAWFNRTNFIESTINSILRQDYPNFDVTIVNDGSTDNEVARQLESYVGSKVRVIHQVNTGFTGAIMRAIDESDGDLIAIHGSGDISHPTRISSQVEAVTRSSTIGIVGCWYFKRDIVSGNIKSYRPVAPTKHTLALFGFSHGELMYKRSAYLRAGGYNTDFPVGQGSDLWSRMLENEEAVVVPKILYMQVIFENGVSTNKSLVSQRSRLDKERQYEMMASRIIRCLAESKFLSVLFKDFIGYSKSKNRFLLSLLYILFTRRLRASPIRRFYLRYFGQGKASSAELASWLES